MVRCPPGQRRNRTTGNCEGCPPGTRRQGRNCVPVAVVPPPAPAPAPVAVAPAPVPIETIHWPARPTRCPTRYTRSKRVPYNCERCPQYHILNNRTRMCDPIRVPPVAVAPAPIPVVPAPVVPPVAPANPNIRPLIIIPRAAGLKCPRGTRRNRRTGNCEGCPTNTRRVGNVCHRIAPVAAPARAPVAAPAHSPAANALTYNGQMRASTNDTEAELNAQAGRIMTIVQRNDPVVTFIAIDATYHLIEDMPLRTVSIHVFMYFMEKTLRLLHAAKVTPAIPVLPDKLRATYTLLYATFLEKALPFNVTSVNRILMNMPRLNPILCAPDMFGNIRLGDEMLEMFEDHGAFYRPNGIVYIKPASLMELQIVALPPTPMVPPAEMFDIEEFGDVPFNPNVPDKFCFVVQDGANISAGTFDIDLVRKAINPRMPRWLYMTCVRPITGYYIGDDTVHHDLYLGLQKMGFPQQVYVNVNQIHTAISNGNHCIIVKPRMVGGRKYVPPLASASLFKIEGGNVVSRSHCEVGHIGGIYDAFLPAAVAVPPAAPLAQAVAEPGFLNRMNPDIERFLAMSDDYHNDRLNDADTDTFEQLKESTLAERLHDYNEFYDWFINWLLHLTGKVIARRENTSIDEIFDYAVEDPVAKDAMESGFFDLINNRSYFKNLNEHDMMTFELLSIFGLSDDDVHA